MRAWGALPGSEFVRLWDWSEHGRGMLQDAPELSSLASSPSVNLAATSASCSRPTRFPLCSASCVLALEGQLPQPGLPQTQEEGACSGRECPPEFPARTAAREPRCTALGGLFASPSPQGTESSLKHVPPAPRTQRVCSTEQEE